MGGGCGRRLKGGNTAEARTIVDTGTGVWRQGTAGIAIAAAAGAAVSSFESHAPSLVGPIPNRQSCLLRGGRGGSVRNVFGRTPRLVRPPTAPGRQTGRGGLRRWSTRTQRRSIRKAAGGGIDVGQRVQRCSPEDEGFRYE